MRKFLLTVLILAVLGGAGYLAQRSGQLDSLVAAVSPGTAAAPAQTAAATGERPAQILPVEVEKARLIVMTETISAIGSLLSDESVQVSAETNGRIAEVGFSEGDRVAAGQVLFKLDDRIIAAQRADAEARLKLAETNYQRYKTLRASGTTAQSNLDTAISDLAVARSALDIVNAQAEKLSITAPFPGVVGFRSVSPGAYVIAGAALVNLEKIDVLKVAFSVPELALASLAAGQKVEVAADALPGETFEGTISAIDPAVDVNGRAIRVRATLDNRDAKLKPGLLARVRVLGVPRNAVAIPESAVVPRAQGSIVFVVEDGKVFECAVVTGARSDGLLEIVQGLAEGQSVVTAGQQRLRNGAAVEIVRAAAMSQG
jgi:membrane fusion protein, multidrug efflux system